MLAIVSLADNWLLVARVEREKVLVGPAGFAVGSKNYPKDGYALIGEDSSTFTLGAARWNGEAWESLGAAPPVDANGEARRLRQFNKLAKTDPVAALLKERNQ